MIPWLDKASDSAFPDPCTALDDPNGLLAAGGDLSLNRLINAYRQGIFPWFSDHDPILWWSPDPRLVIWPNQIHISRRLIRNINKLDYRITVDQAFDQVIDACSQSRPGQDGTWILPVMKTAYTQLHTAGFAHSVEVWMEQKLVAGIYGVAVGRAFFGESMFHTVSNTSKIALIALCQILDKIGYKILDCQVDSPHLRSMGAEIMPRAEFCEFLKELTTDTTNQTPVWHSVDCNDKIEFSNTDK